jgi:hypothetical protein
MVEANSNLKITEIDSTEKFLNEQGIKFSVTIILCV